jgi:predicted nucleic acid-binding protein
VTREPVLIDVGPIVALVRKYEEHHAACEHEVNRLRLPLLTCWPVVTEAAWLLRNDPVALTGVFEMFRTGDFKFLPMDETALPAVQAYLNRYADLPAQFADACLLHLADREGIRTIFTLDRRDFQVYRIGRNRPLRLLPENLQ